MNNIEEPLSVHDMDRLVLSVCPSYIVLISWIVSEYNGLGYIRTDDPRKGELSFFCPPSQSKEGELLIEKLREEGFPVKIERVERHKKQEGTEEYGFSHF
ncbi:hypothetical protein [Aminobacterium mobile]